MKQLITPQQVMTIAFGTTHTLREEEIPNHTILAVQQRLLRPVVGNALFEQLTSEQEELSPELSTLVENYLATPLALYVGSLLIPTLAAKVGSVGVVSLAGGDFEAVDEPTLRRVCRRLRADADALMDVAVEHIEGHPELYPLYDPEANVRSRLSLRGGVVL